MKKIQILKKFQLGLYIFLLTIYFIRTTLSNIQTCSKNANAICPFDDLSSKEIESVLELIRSKSSLNTKFPLIMKTLEPPKNNWILGKISKNYRVAYLILIDYANYKLTEVHIDLNKKKVIMTKKLDRELPPMLDSESKEAHKLIMEDEKFIVAMTERGFNISYIILTVWPIGSLGIQLNPPGTIMIYALPYYFNPDLMQYPYYSPIEGLFFKLDLISKNVEIYEDTKIRNPKPPVYQFQTNSANIPKKFKLKPLEILQPKGTSFKLNGQNIEWYKWNFRYSFDIQYGVQLHQIYYESDCKKRSVIYKIGITEMLVPYGVKDPTWKWRTAMDVGDYFLGYSTSPFVIGQDLPENAIVLNCTIFYEKLGKTIEKNGCMAIFEKDMGILYKHKDTHQSQSTIGKRGRQLQIAFATTVGNYDYVIYYIFNMDGTIEVEVRLTGILLARGVNSASNDMTCIQSCHTYVNNYIIAPTHQHFFNFRIDFDLDGLENVVMESNVVTLPKDPILNADGGAFDSEKVLLEYETYRDYNIETDRKWFICNLKQRNIYNHPRCYTIKPMDFVYSYLQENDPQFPQVKFVQHPFWITKYKDEEKGGAGIFPRSGIPQQGLPTYISDREYLINKDLVIWYTFGVTHVTRPEEWPLMNYAKVGFQLTPFQFISYNSEIPLQGKCP